MQASAREALGHASVRPECAVGLSKHREGSMETAKRKSPPVRVCGTLFCGHTYGRLSSLLSKQTHAPLWRWRWAHPDDFQIQVSEITADMEQIVFKYNHGAALIRVPPGTFQRYLYTWLRLTGG